MKLRSYMKMLNINITHIPSRFWSNSLIYSKNSNNIIKKNSKKLCKTLYGNILWFHNDWPEKNNLNIDEIITNNNKPIYSIYKQIQHYLIQNNVQVFIEQENTSIYNEFSSLFQQIHKQDSFCKNSKLILPWDSIANGTNKTLKQKNSKKNEINKLIFESWIKKSEKTSDDVAINTLLTLLKNNRLIYAGMLDIKDSQNSYLYFDNIDTLRLKLTKNLKLNPLDYSQNQSLICFDPYFFSVFNRKYLLFF